MISVPCSDPAGFFVFQFGYLKSYPPAISSAEENVDGDTVSSMLYGINEW
jgi:hypothetical protein